VGSFYENTPEPTAPAASTAPVNATASALYSTPAPVVDRTATAEVQAARAADVGRSLYPTDKMFHGSGLDQVDGLDHVAAAEVLRDLGADPSDARQLATLTQALPNVIASDIEAWVAETSRIPASDMALARQYLKTDDRARQFIERHPDLAYHPETCKRVISLAKAAAIRKGSK
jgi:hypothetical protein